MMRTCILAGFMVIAMAALSNAMAAGADDARQFVDSVGKRVLEVVNNSGISEDQKQTQLQQMFAANVDIPWMGKFVLGRAWQQATADQRTRYLQAYQDYLLAHYTANFTDYTGAKYTITDMKSEEEGQFTVSMQVNAPKQPQDTVAGYRLRSDNGQFKIVDIIVEGVSLITTQRSEFAAVVQKDGMDGLITDLINKKQSEKQKS